MIIRVATYHALPGKDAEGWMRSTADTVRGVKGLHRVEFVRAADDPLQYGLVMLFGSKEELRAYKTSEVYSRLVQALQEAWADTSKPLTEQVFEVLDF